MEDSGLDIELRKASLELFPLFNDFMSDMSAHGETLWAPYTPKVGEAPELFIQKILSRSTRPEPGLVPEDVYWALYDGKLAGRISLRHFLNDNLKKVGGHIGYEVRPACRRRGIATAMLREVLKTKQAKEIKKLLLTCDPKNIASVKTILANGGVLSQTLSIDTLGTERSYYWIEL